MEIEHITDPAIIATIIKLDDPGLEENVLIPTGMSKIEWIQYLNLSLKTYGPDYFRIYGIKNNDKLTAYMVAQNGMDPPMRRVFVIRYLTLLTIDKDKRESLGDRFIEKVKEWAAEFGCHEILIIANNEKMARMYEIKTAFKRTPHIVMRLEF